VNEQIHPSFQISNEVIQALESHSPVVALESTVITHGLPFPENLELAQDMEAEVRQMGAIPATVAVLDGKIIVGLQPDQLGRLANGHDVHKISTRDFAPALCRNWSGGTTVAGTMFAAYAAGIRIFATGGIGGIHRYPPYDVSADLPQLAKTPMIVVCAGAKAILDLTATLEYLETHAVPVVGYQTDEFPAFFSRGSGLKVSARADTPEEVARIARNHWLLGMTSAVLVTVPPPEKVALPLEEVSGVIDLALKDAEALDIKGQQVTPYLLKRISELTSGKSLRANLGLLRNDARVAAEISKFII
jgi:pseudouridine-5'-phosphate glycosidase